MLMQAGWPREALLITVVRDKNGDGHAVLTVKTDKGEFILDNQTDDILLWSDTGYRFVKRQSQTDPNVWVSLGDPRPAPPTADRALTANEQGVTRPRSRPHPSPSPDRVRARPALPQEPAAPFFGRPFAVGPQQPRRAIVFVSVIGVCVQPVSATPLVVYRLAFRSPRSFADVD